MEQQVRTELKNTQGGVITKETAYRYAQYACKKISYDLEQYEKTKNLVGNIQEKITQGKELTEKEQSLWNTYNHSKASFEGAFWKLWEYWLRFGPPIKTVMDGIEHSFVDRKVKEIIWNARLGQTKVRADRLNWHSLCRDLEANYGFLRFIPNEILEEIVTSISDDHYDKINARIIPELKPIIDTKDAYFYAPIAFFSNFMFAMMKFLPRPITDASSVMPKFLHKGKELFRLIKGDPYPILKVVFTSRTLKAMPPAMQADLERAFEENDFKITKNQGVLSEVITDDSSGRTSSLFEILAHFIVYSKIAKEENTGFYFHISPIKMNTATGNEYIKDQWKDAFTLFGHTLSPKIIHPVAYAGTDVGDGIETGIFLYTKEILSHLVEENEERVLAYIKASDLADRDDVSDQEILDVAKVAGWVFPINWGPFTDVLRDELDKIKELGGKEYKQSDLLNPSRYMYSFILGGGVSFKPMSVVISAMLNPSVIFDPFVPDVKFW